MQFGLTIFASAFLLFLVQPLISKAILPWYGGSPALWTACMLFFQVALLAGYGYAHLSLTRLRPRAQVTLHLALLAAAALALPILPASDWKPAPLADPTWHVLGLLTAHLGLPFLTLAATTPLIQGWYGQAGGGALPYRFYALSNLASLLALLGYPLVLQPLLDLPGQSRLWSLGFACYGAACLLAARAVWRAAPPPAEGAVPGAGAPRAGEAGRGGADGPAPSGAERALWLLLPACASVALLAITSRLSQDVAVVPFLWVVPLLLYLLSFVLTFERERWYDRRWAAPLFAALLPLALWLQRAGALADVRLLVAGYAALLFTLCMICHGELARLKPAPRRASGYYLTIAAGGALGGLLVGLVAPRLFATYLELPLALLGAWVLLLVCAARDPAGWLRALPPRRRRAALLVGALAALALGEGARQVERRTREAAVALERNFFGVLAVTESRRVRVLRHGNVMHGIELLGGGPVQPGAYYGETSGVGRLLRARAGASREPLTVGAVGLGAGTIAAYGRPGDRYTFYELDPAVAAAARAWFRFLPESRAEVEVVLGDARLSLEREPPRGFDVLVLDAFSSDAVPVHLLTEEAFEHYLRHLAPGGVIAVHITNRTLDLYPVLAAHARHRGLRAELLESDGRQDPLGYRNRWCLLARERAALEHPLLRTTATPAEIPRLRRWTDAYSDLLAILRLRR